VQEFSRRWGLHVLSAVCRSQYAGVLIWRGEWAQAEEELVHSARELERLRPGMTAAAVARLGHLRLRQGKFDDAERLFTQGHASTHARMGLAALMLERGNAHESAALLEQVLGQIGDGEATLRADCLELAVRAEVARGDQARAAAHLEELERIATAVGTDPMIASLAMARSAVERARGNLDAATVCLAAAVERFDRSGSPFETASARVELAEVYRELGREESAQREAHLAESALASLGATARAQRARRLMQKSSRLLTVRQTEILRYIATGMSNADIARRLDLSEHTVKRHVANLLMKLDLPSRTAAAAYAAREGLL
jgi:DNA-binding NarL/FixJ family response regulator